LEGATATGRFIKKETGEVEIKPLDFADVFSRLSFWYGLDYWTIRRMPLSAIRNYAETLDRRQAEMRMMMAEAASVPHLDEAAHGEWARSIREYFESERRAEIVAPRKLAGAGIQAVFVPPVSDPPVSEYADIPPNATSKSAFGGR
jgi:hypothetical protein